MNTTSYRTIFGDVNGDVRKATGPGYSVGVTDRVLRIALRIR